MMMITYQLSTAFLEQLNGTSRVRRKHHQALQDQGWKVVQDQQVQGEGKGRRVLSFLP